jgi:hypothetical protein
MVFSAKWPIQASLSWQRAVGGLVKELENDGCVIFGDGMQREVFVPGLDERMLSYFRNGSEEGLMTEDWKNFLQRELWGRARISLNPENRMIEYRWTYWTSFQIAFHALLAMLFFGTGCRFEWAWLLFVPTIFAFNDALTLYRRFSLWHAKCSLG